MLTNQLNHAESHHSYATEPAIISETYNNYTITNQSEIRKKLNLLFNKNTLLSVKAPGKLVTSTLLTTITFIEGNHIYLGGFQNERFNKDLLSQNRLVASANFEGIAVNFILNEFTGHDIDGTFNLKIPIPQSIEWVQKRDARRVKIPISSPVIIQYKNRNECFSVIDISVTGLSYSHQPENQHSIVIGELHTDCNIVLPDKSAFLAQLKIVNNITIPTRSKQINRIGCEIKQASYRLDTALQYLINQIDFHYQ
ncbi:flagellar brake protein [Candidatus Methylobacter oryzae]|nr:flagellar brake protein [Candidatus Methylobacter oryzae]